MRKFVGVSLALVGVSLGFACGDDDDSSPIDTQGRGGSSLGGSAGVSGTGGGNPAGAAGSPAGAAGSSSGAAGSSSGSGGSAGGTPFVPTCTTAGTGATRVLKGRVVAPDQVFEQGEVVIGTDGLISCVGADCSAAPGYAESTTVTCTGGVITPSLINTHDHITFAQNKPKPHTAKYNHRNEWRRGAGQDLPKISVPGGNGNDTVAWGELRFVMGGATSTVGSGGVKGMMRNLDRVADQQEGLNQKPVKFETFPLNDSQFDKIPTECLYNGFDTTATVTAEEAYLPHISEGINDGAHNEFDCIKGFGGAPADYLQKQTAIVHAIGVTASDAVLMSAEGVGVIWSPRSNIDLYGVTANVVQFAKLGVQIALGTDWSASGSYNLLRELACADSYNTKNLGGAFSSHDLYRMVTENAAAVLASDDKIGSLKVGLVGDVTIWAGTGKPDPYAAVTKANLPDVLLVMRSGIALYGEPAAVDALSPDAGVGCELVGDGGLTDVCGVPRKVCAKREFGKSIAELRASISKNGSAELYNLYYCDAAAAAEPSCEPSRPGEFTGVPTADDSDGDGIPNATDKCPTIFSPTRPMDG
ncbi:MAG: amidohydrolase family protein, partial [Polyangiaceae bacterium]|nr:amidohydrolase family protein [Polyangiaceae bacterium]